jgi:hypothetical protein
LLLVQTSQIEDADCLKFESLKTLLQLGFISCVGSTALPLLAANIGTLIKVRIAAVCRKSDSATQNLLHDLPMFICSASDGA